MPINTKKLTSEVFQEGMNKLEAVFQDKKVNEAFLKVYYERLNFCTDREFLQAVDDILDKSNWFPTIKLFLEWLPEPEVYQPSIESLLS